jgi:hypothetical protein
MPEDINKFTNFLHTFGTARLLLQEAHKNGSLLEGLALYASITDALLRIALVLKNQTVNRLSTIDESLISQEIDGSYYTERKIQKMALTQGVINEGLWGD